MSEERTYSPAIAEACGKAFRLTIDAMREAARQSGYALAVHGSLNRDIDLIAVPWTAEADAPEFVAERIRAAAEKANPMGVAFLAPHTAHEFPRQKPHGRQCWSWHLGAGPYIDLSVMPRIS